MNKKIIYTFITLFFSVFLFSMTQSIDSYANEYNGFTMDKINNSEIKPRVYITVDGKEKGKLYTVSDRGKIVKVSINVEGAKYKYANTGFHIYYSDKLELTRDPNFGTINVIAGKAISKLSAGNPKEDPTAGTGFKGVFVATAGDSDLGLDGEMWTLEFRVPSNAKAGDVYPIDIIYNSNENAEDLFYNTAMGGYGHLMHAYTFTKGIYNPKENRTFYPDYDDIKNCVNLADIDRSMDGYIAIAVPPQTTTASTTITSPTTTTTVTTPVVLDLGDINADKKVDAKDASEILVYYSKMSTGAETILSEDQLIAANLNEDSLIDAKDASLILSYYSYISTHDPVSLSDFLKGNIPAELKPTSIGEIIYDNNDILVKYNGIETKNSLTSINIYVENNTNIDRAFQVRNTSINGFMVQGIISTDIAAGKKANTAIKIQNSELEKNGITNIDEIEFSLHSFTWDTTRNEITSKPIQIRVN